MSLSVREVIHNPLRGTPRWNCVWWSHGSYKGPGVLSLHHCTSHTSPEIHNDLCPLTYWWILILCNTWFMCVWIESLTLRSISMSFLQLNIVAFQEVKYHKCMCLWLVLVVIRVIANLFNKCNTSNSNSSINIYCKQLVKNLPTNVGD